MFEKFILLSASTTKENMHLFFSWVLELTLNKQHMELTINMKSLEPFTLGCFSVMTKYRVFFFFFVNRLLKSMFSSFPGFGSCVFSLDS